MRGFKLFTFASVNPLRQKRLGTIWYVFYSEIAPKLQIGSRPPYKQSCFFPSSWPKKCSLCFQIVAFETCARNFRARFPSQGENWKLHLKNLEGKVIGNFKDGHCFIQPKLSAQSIDELARKVPNLNPPERQQMCWRQPSKSQGFGKIIRNWVVSFIVSPTTQIGSVNVTERQSMSDWSKAFTTPSKPINSEYDSRGKKVRLYHPAIPHSQHWIERAQVSKTSGRKGFPWDTMNGLCHSNASSNNPRCAIVTILRRSSLKPAEFHSETRAMSLLMSNPRKDNKHCTVLVTTVSVRK